MRFSREQLLGYFRGSGNVRALSRVVRQTESLQTHDAYRIRYNGDGPRAFFDSYADHPRIFVPIPNDPEERKSSASGAYQVTATTYDYLRQQHSGLDDFSPETQDALFVACLVKRDALQDVLDGRFDEAVAKCRLEWTSLPGAAESNARWTLAKARELYQQYGGRLTPETTQPSTLTPEEQTMPLSPIALGAIPELIKSIPALIGLFGPKGEKAAQRVAAAETVINAFVGAVPGATNVQDAVEKTNADPALKAAARVAVESNPAVASLIEVGGGVAAARKSNDDYMARLEDDAWWRMLLKIPANPALLVSAAGLYLVYLFVVPLAAQVSKLSEAVVAAIIMSVIGTIVGAIFGFWLGQTWQQKKGASNED
jgi:muramidase (phage lysozyme)